MRLQVRCIRKRNSRIRSFYCAASQNDRGITILSHDHFENILRISQELEQRLRLEIGLSQHSNARLLQDVVAR